MVHRCLWTIGALLLVFGVSLPVAAQDAGAQVRILHASPDTPPVDVFVDGQAVLENVGFASISDYLDVSAGEHTLALAPAGQGEAAAVITASPTFGSGKAYTVAAIGLAEVSAQVYEDDLSPVAEGKARARIIHLSPDAPGADVEVVGGGPLAQGIAYTESSGYLDVDAGTYDLRLVAAGANTVIVQLPDTTLEAGTIYDVVAVGRLANIQVVVGTAQPTQAVAGANGEAPSENVQNTMPNTGSTSWQPAVLGLALVLILGGIALRRRSSYPI